MAKEARRFSAWEERKKFWVIFFPFRGYHLRNEWHPWKKCGLGKQESGRGWIFGGHGGLRMVGILFWGSESLICCASRILLLRQRQFLSRKISTREHERRMLITIWNLSPAAFAILMRKILKSAQGQIDEKSPELIFPLRIFQAHDWYTEEKKLLGILSQVRRRKESSGNNFRRNKKLGEKRKLYHSVSRWRKKGGNSGARKKVVWKSRNLAVKHCRAFFPGTPIAITPCLHAIRKDGRVPFLGSCHNEKWNTWRVHLRMWAHVWLSFEPSHQSTFASLQYRANFRQGPFSWREIQECL